MRKITICIAAALALAVPTPVLDAQPAPATQAQVDSLAAKLTANIARIDATLLRLDMLDSIVGTKRFINGPQIPCPEMEAARPKYWFANGEYPIDYRQKQLGCGTNDLAAHVDYAENLVNQIALKLPPDSRTVPEFVASSIAASRISPIFTGGITVKGDVVASMGRFCSFYAENGVAKLGSVEQKCKTGAQVQTYGEGAQIDFCANIDAKYGGGVSPFKPHCGRLGVAPEGGLRLGYNEPFNNPWPDVSREWAYAGYDSAGRWCYYKSTPGATHDNTQDFCIDIEEPSKTVWLSTWRPLWKVGVINSTGLITLDQRRLIGPAEPQQ